MTGKETSGATQRVVSRRDAVALSGAALAGAAGFIAATRAAHAEPDGHAGQDHHHDHHDHTGHDGPAQDSQHRALIDAATHCITTGEACVPHCVDLMAKGDPSLAECLEAVLVMMPMCTAVARAARFDAARLKAVVALCRDVCEDCETVCRKHAEHHAVCKACADSCAAFVKESKTLT